MCGQQTPPCETIVEHGYMKSKMCFTEIILRYGDYLNFGYYHKIRSLNFCPSCAKKSYTIEELKTIGNYNQWSY